MIGKAIGDCITCDNEFKGKSSDDVITFKGTKPEQYTPANWNAVILYNYVNFAINNYVDFTINCFFGGNINSNLNKVFSEIGKKVRTEYTTYYTKNNLTEKITELNDSIDKAISDIKSYNDALNLDSYLAKFASFVSYRHVTSRLDGLAPEMNTAELRKEEKSFRIKCVYFKEDIYFYDGYLRHAYTPCFYQENCEWHIIGVKSVMQSFNKKTLQWLNIVSEEVIAEEEDIKYEKKCNLLFNKVLKLLDGLIAPI